MAVTQYIGSRYVPMFADPAEWSAENTYESLTIVLHEGNSYTSKQAVPKGVAISNEDYWVLTGNYNAQIEQYRRETARVAATIGDRFTEDDTISDYAADVDSILDGFTTSEPVKPYIETKTNEIVDDRLAPLVKSGMRYDQGIADTYFWYMLTFPKDMFDVNIKPNGDPIGSSATLLDYARREKPYFCVNCTNNEHFVYNGIEYNGDTQYFPPTRSGFFAKRSRDDVDFTLFRADGNTSVRTIKELGYNYVTGAWQPLIMGGIAVPIDSYATFSDYNPEACLGFDADNFYYCGFYGRMYEKPGVTAKMVQDFGIARDWDGLIYFDGGDSVRAMFAEVAPLPIVPRVNATGTDRLAYCNVTFERKL